MGALTLLRAGNRQVDDVQLVEPPGLDPHITVLIAGGHGHKIQRHRRCKAVAVLVIGVVAAQLCTAGSRVDLHLPPWAEIRLELFQRGAVARPLPCQLCRVAAVQRPEFVVPRTLRDLPVEKCTGRHPDPSSKSCRGILSVCYAYCNPSVCFLQFLS